MKVSSEIIDMSPGNKKPEKKYFLTRWKIEKTLHWLK